MKSQMPCATLTFLRRALGDNVGGPALATQNTAIGMAAHHDGLLDTRVPGGERGIINPLHQSSRRRPVCDLAGAPRGRTGGRCGGQRRSDDINAGAGATTLGARLPWSPSTPGGPNPRRGRRTPPSPTCRSRSCCPEYETCACTRKLHRLNLGLYMRNWCTIEIQQRHLETEHWAAHRYLSTAPSASLDDALVGERSAPLAATRGSALV